MRVVNMEPLQKERAMAKHLMMAHLENRRIGVSCGKGKPHPLHSEQTWEMTTTRRSLIDLIVRFVCPFSILQQSYPLKVFVMLHFRL